MSGNVIKRDTAERLLHNTKQFNFQSVEAEAKRIIENAYEQAEAQIARAKREIDAMREEIRGQEFETARKEGFDKGYEDGLAQGTEKGQSEAYETNLAELRESVSDLPTTLTELAKELEKRRSTLIEDAENDLMALSLAIAEKVVAMKLETDPNIVKGTLRRAIDLILKRASLDLMVSTDDVIAIEEYMPELRKIFGDLGSVRLHADMGISRGSVVVRAGRGEIDMRLEDQVHEIAALMIDEDPEEMRKRLEKYDRDDGEGDVFTTIDDSVDSRLAELDRLKEMGEVSLAGEEANDPGDESSSSLEESSVSSGDSGKGAFTRVMRAFDLKEDEGDATPQALDEASTADLLNEIRSEEGIEDDAVNMQTAQIYSQKVESDAEAGKRDKSSGRITAVLSNLMEEEEVTEPRVVDTLVEERDTDRVHVAGGEDEDETAKHSKKDSGKLTEALAEFDTSDLAKMAESQATTMNPDGTIAPVRGSENLTDVDIDDLLRGNG